MTWRASSLISKDGEATLKDTNRVQESEKTKKQMWADWVEVNTRNESGNTELTVWGIRQLHQESSVFKEECINSEVLINFEWQLSEMVYMDIKANKLYNTDPNSIEYQ